jgi:hypothetical protein
MIEGQWYSTIHHRRMTTWGGAAATLWGLFVMFVVLDPSSGGETSLAYGRFVAIAWIGSGLILLLRGRRAAVSVGTLGLEVRNAWRSSFYRWEDIADFGTRALGGDEEVGVVLLKTGQKRRMTGIRIMRGSDRDRLIEGLRDQLERRQPPPRW